MGSIKRFLFILILIFLFFSLTKNIFDYRNALTFYKSNKEEYDKAKKAHTELQTAILKYNDPHEIEKTIRNKLNLLKDNEVAVILPQPTPTPYTPTPTPAPVYRQWYSTFFGN